MSAKYFKAGDEVAILPSVDSPVSSTLEIGIINHAGTVYIQLTDGRMYSAIGGVSLLANSKTFIVAATDGHRRGSNKSQKQNCLNGISRHSTVSFTKPPPMLYNAMQ